MKTLLEDRLIYLWSRERHLTVQEEYELTLLKSLHPTGMVSNTPIPIPLPEYGDQADLINILLALTSIQTRILNQIQSMP